MKISICPAGDEFQVVMSVENQSFKVGPSWDCTDHAYRYMMLLRTALLKSGVNSVELDAVMLNPDWFIPGGLEKFVDIVQSLLKKQKVLPVIHEQKVIANLYEIHSDELPES